MVRVKGAGGGWSFEFGIGPNSDQGLFDQYQIAGERQPPHQAYDADLTSVCTTRRNYITPWTCSSLPQTLGQTLCGTHVLSEPIVRTSECRSIDESVVTSRGTFIQWSKTCMSHAGRSQPSCPAIHQVMTHACSVRDTLAMCSDTLCAYNAVIGHQPEQNLGPALLFWNCDEASRALLCLPTHIARLQANKCTCLPFRGAPTHLLTHPLACFRFLP